jgi:hypothetical protein
VITADIDVTAGTGNYTVTADVTSAVYNNQTYLVRQPLSATAVPISVSIGAVNMNFNLSLVPQLVQPRFEYVESLAYGTDQVSAVEAGAANLSAFAGMWAAVARREYDAVLQAARWRTEQPARSFLMYVCVCVFLCLCSFSLALVGSVQVRGGRV